MERIDATNVRLAANPAAGIAELSDLKGKRVGVATGSTSHYHLLRALAKANLKSSDLTLVNLTPANMPPAYVAGQIDAAFVWEPNVGAIQHAGAKPIATTKSLGMITGGVWVARKAFTEGSPETVQLFLKAWNQAQKDYKAKPAEVRQYEAKRVDKTSEQFDKLVAGQGAAHPTFEDSPDRRFHGPPGQEAKRLRPASTCRVSPPFSSRRAHPGSPRPTGRDCFIPSRFRPILRASNEHERPGLEHRT